MHWNIQLTSETLPKKKLRKTTGRNTMWGVFKAYAVFFSLLSLLFHLIDVPAYLEEGCWFSMLRTIMMWYSSWGELLQAVQVSTLTTPCVNPD